MKILIKRYKGVPNGWIREMVAALPAGSFVPVTEVNQNGTYSVCTDPLPPWLISNKNIIVPCDDSILSKVDVFNAACELAGVFPPRRIQDDLDEGALSSLSMETMNRMWNDFIRQGIIKLL